MYKKIKEVDDELIIASNKLAFQKDKIKKLEKELIIIYKELAFQNEEKEKCAAELDIADLELDFQNKERCKRAAELVIADRELDFQNNEKWKRAAELSIANIELAFQDDEKEKRAQELIIANEELIFQNNEKEKRAQELIIANKELAFQNDEKEKRAQELIVANKELAFQNDEKEKRAQELIIANKELAFQNDEKEKITKDLVHRNKDLEQFSYIISHNLRAPVANIIGVSDILQEPLLDVEISKVMLSSLSNSVNRLDTVIKDLNHILQVKHEVTEKNEKVKFSQTVEEIKISISNLIKNEHVEIITDFDKVDKIFALKSYLHSVFYNLISNSIKYRKPDINPKIEIKSRVIKNKIVLTFKDNGLGIDLEKKGDQVFGLYKRFHLHKEGKGMGLYMAKNQVETMGGSIAVSSKVNKWTEFRIEFDLHKHNI